jgi:hypothetical protein
MRTTSFRNHHLLVLSSIDARLLLDFLDTGDFRECTSHRLDLLEEQRQLIHELYEALGNANPFAIEGAQEM